MLHVALPLPTRYFSPIGSTPAVSLIAHQPPAKETADILLLGCGDIRNILYTVFCNQNGKHGYSFTGLTSVQDPLKAKHLVFTCCDIEPAILGRVPEFSQMS